MSNSSTLPTPAEILGRFYAAERTYMSAPPNERDFSGMAATLSPDLKAIQSPDLPYGGEWVGHEGFLSWAKTMSELFDVLDVQDPKVFEREGDEVVVLSTLYLRVRKSGKELKNPLCQVVKVDRKAGVITEIRPFYWDVKGLNEALEG